jgi:hypothetical protein
MPANNLLPKAAPTGARGVEPGGAAAPSQLACDDPKIEPFTVTVARTRELTGWSTATIYREAAKGHLELLKAGRKTLITYASLKARIASLPRATIKSAA